MKNFEYIGLCILLILTTYILETLGLKATAIFTLAIPIIYSIIITDSRNIFQLMWILSMVLFGAIPPVLLISVDLPVNLDILRLLTLLTCMVIALTNTCNYAGVTRSSISVTPKSSYSAIALAMAAMFLTDGLSYIFFAPLLVFVLVTASAKSSGTTVFGLCSAFLLYFTIYVLIYWDGFGRLVLGASVIPLYLMLVHERGWWFNKYAFIVGTSVAALLLSLTRIKDATLQTALLSDSLVSPYILATELINTSTNRTLNFNGWVLEFLNYFYAIFPREFWKDKPIGFGRAYVLQEMNLDLIDAGHSVAALFIGDSLYYLLNFWIVGIILSLGFLILLLRYLHSLDNRSGLYTILICGWVPTFFWGGIHSFAIRFQLGLILFLMFIFIRKSLKYSTNRSFRH